MRKTTPHLGLDVHKDSITVALAKGRRNGEVRIHSTISNDLHPLEKLLARVREAHPGVNATKQAHAGLASPVGSRSSVFPARSLLLRSVPVTG